jgi:hypothetical protein
MRWKFPVQAPVKVLPGLNCSVAGRSSHDRRRQWLSHPLNFKGSTSSRFGVSSSSPFKADLISLPAGEVRRYLSKQLQSLHRALYTAQHHNLFCLVTVEC